MELLRISSPRLRKFILALQNCVIPHLGEIKAAKSGEWRVHPLGQGQESAYTRNDINLHRSQYKFHWKRPQRGGEANSRIYPARVLPSCAERDLDKAARKFLLSCIYARLCAYQRISAAPDLERFSPEIYAADPGALLLAKMQSGLWHRRRATITLCDAELILKGRPTQTKQTTR